MTEFRLQELIKQGENVSVEFKKNSTELSSTTFESVCAFLNRSGGHLILGVKDSGEIVGIKENCIDSIIKNFINIANNDEQLNPTFSFSPEVFEIGGKKVIYIYVAESSEVHRFKGKVYDRVGDADNDITKRHSLIDNIYLRKRKEFSENEVLPFLEMDELDSNTFEKARRLASLFDSNHPWKTMSDEEILRSSGFWGKDRETGKEGFILAAALLFGKENTISNYCPAYKTDAVYRNMTYNRFLHPLPDDPDVRYDDRDTIRVNLIEAYDRLMKFVHRNLPEKFYLPPSGSTQRIDIRSYIFREIAANTLVHREYSHSFPAKFLIFSDRVITENWTKPSGKSHASLDDLETHTKNPMITKIFKEIGHVEELGSGRKNIQKYAPLYYKDYKVEVDNEEKFVFSITYKDGDESVNEPLKTRQETDNVKAKIYNLIDEAVSGVVNGALSGAVKDELVKVIEILSDTPGKNRKALVEIMRKGSTTLDRYLKLLKDANIIAYIGSDKTGGYYLTDKAKENLN